MKIPALVAVLLGTVACSSDFVPRSPTGCDSSNGQGCLCGVGLPACPGGATCTAVSANSSKTFCSLPCDPQRQDMCLYMGVTLGQCQWQLNIPGPVTLGCGLHCGAERSCPAGFGPMDVQPSGGQPFCACLPN